MVGNGEKFGLVASDDATSFGGLMDKEEPRDELLDLTLHDDDEIEHILRYLDISCTSVSPGNDWLTLPISNAKALL